MTSLAFAAVVVSCLSISAARGEDPFSAAIRPTDAKTPKEERQSFHVPPGFEVQLVVAEPDIQKPMNLAFDARAADADQDAANVDIARQFWCLSVLRQGRESDPFNL